MEHRDEIAFPKMFLGNKHGCLSPSCALLAVDLAITK